MIVMLLGNALWCYKLDVITVSYIQLIAVHRYIAITYIAYDMLCFVDYIIANMWLANYASLQICG